MTAPDDVNPEMPGSPFDDETLEALLSGRLDPADAPPALRSAAELVKAARGAAPAGDAAREEALLAAVTAVVREQRGVASLAHHTRRSVLGKVVSAKALVVVATVTVAGGVAAAATGSFPSSVQSTLAGAASHVGITLPKPATSHGQHTGGAATAADTGDSGDSGDTGVTGTSGAGTSGTSGTTGTTGTSGSGTTGTTGGGTTTTTTTTVPTTTTLPADTFGLCNAYLHVSKDYTDLTAPGIVHSQAFQRLAAEATADGAASVQAFCAPILGLPAPTTTSTSTTTTTPTTTTVAPHKHHGKPPKPGSKGHGSA